MKMFQKLTAWLLTFAMLMTLMPTFALGVGASVTAIEDIPLISDADTAEIRAEIAVEPTIPAPAANTAEPDASAVLLSGESGNTGDCTWTFDSGTGTLTVGGTGAMEGSYTGGSQPWYAYKDSIETVIVEKGVTVISPYAFYEFPALKTVKIAGSVTAIGNNAFASCSALTTAEYYGSTNAAASSNVFSGTSLFVVNVLTTYDSDVFCGKMARATLDAANEPVPSAPAVPTDYPLWVGGEQITSEKLTVTGAAGAATYAPDTNTLTLNNYTYSGAGYGQDILAAIYYKGTDTLKLVLIGESSVTHTPDNANASSGMYVHSDLSVSGDGSLTAVAGKADYRSSGIRAGGSISISGGELTGVGNESGQFSDGVLSNGGNITVAGGKLAGTGNKSVSFSSGVFADSGSIIVQGGNLIGNGGASDLASIGMHATSITVSGGTAEAVGAALTNSYASSRGAYTMMGSITISGGSLTATGGSSANDGSSYGVWADMSEITVSGGSLTATGGTAYLSEGAHANTITLSGGETVAQGNTAAFNNAPTIGSTFTNAGLWYGEDEASAVSGPISNLANRYTEKFVKVAENDTPPVFSVGISAVDTANGEEIAGATLQILDSAGFVVDEWVSAQDDTETTAVDESIYMTTPLNIGTTYTLRAVVAPVGYILSSDTTFRIGSDGKPVTTGSMTLDGVLLIGFDRTEVKILAVDAVDESTAIRGATLQILDSTGTVVEEWGSLDDPHTIYALETGVPYTLHAAVAPNGYTIPSDQQFATDEGGRITFSGSKTQDGTLLLGFMPIQRYSVTSAAEPAAGGSITLSVNEAARDEAFDVTVTVNDGYAVAGLYYVDDLGSETPFSAGGNSIQSPGTHTVSMPLDSPVQILVRFAPKVTFVDWDGVPLREQYVLYGSAATAPDPAPSLEGHTFIGWDPAFDNVTAPLTVTAQYRPNQYTITFMGLEEEVLATITQVCGTPITPPADPVMEAYTFKGWHTPIPVTMPAENMTIHAVFRGKPIVTFKDWNSDVLRSGYVDAETSATAPPDPTREGYTFVGWDTPFDNVTDDLTVTALYRANQYTFTFDSDGGSAVDPITQDYGTEISAPAAPSKPGYIFAGWDKDLPETMPAEDLTFTAQWRRVTYSGGSYAPTTSTSVSKNEDGSTTTVTENKATGAKTEVTTNPDGSSVMVETKPDGTVTTTEKTKDGTSVKTHTPAGGETTAEVKTSVKTEVTVPVPEADAVTGVVVTDKNGNKTELKDFEVTANGVKFPVSGDCTVSFSRAEKKAFEDVHPVNHWALADVDYAYVKGLMKGTSETHFSPDAPLTRAMLVTILYRHAGEPATNRSIPFADVDMGAYYGNAVSWAKQNGIVTGISETHFAPDVNITREQFAAIIFRYAMAKGMNAVTMEENLHFKDAGEISAYAVSAMNWAVGAGLIKGRSASTVAPKDNATRAEAAAILHRFLESGKA